MSLYSPTHINQREKMLNQLGHRKTGDTYLNKRVEHLPQKEKKHYL